jgi:hypothetical protein
MKITDIFSTKSIAFRVTQAGSNLEQYIGPIIFPPMKKMGLDLKWLVASNGLPISLSPAQFDTKDTIRARVGIDVKSTQMAFFRESMTIGEQDEQEIMRVQESTDPYALQVLQHIYNDVDKLTMGAAVVPERMIMQLLAPTVDGSPRINIAANGVTYTYNYDPDGAYQTNNYAQVSTKWSTVTSTPITDVQAAQSAIYIATGSKPTNMLISYNTMINLTNNTQVRNAILAQNTTATIFITPELIKNVFMMLLGINVVVYQKKYKNEAGTAANFYPDGYATLFPDGALGNTWYGTTPEERTLMGNREVDVSIVNTGVAVAISEEVGPPVITQTTVSEIVLPSYERMMETYVLKTEF